METQLPTTQEIDKVLRNLFVLAEERFIAVKRDTLSAVWNKKITPLEGVEIMNEAYKGYIETLKALRSLS